MGAGLKPREARKETRMFQGTAASVLLICKTDDGGALHTPPPRAPIPHATPVTLPPPSPHTALQRGPRSRPRTPRPVCVFEGAPSFPISFCTPLSLMRPTSVHFCRRPPLPTLARTDGQQPLPPNPSNISSPLSTRADGLSLSLSA